MTAADPASSEGARVKMRALEDRLREQSDGVTDCTDNIQEMINLSSLDPRDAEIATLRKPLNSGELTQFREDMIHCGVQFAINQWMDNRKWALPEPDARDADAGYWMNKCEEALKRSGENKARADAAVAEIATLRAALDPFADCVNEGWAPDELKDDDVVMVRVKHHQGYTLKVSDFRRAAAIKQAEGK